MTERAMLSRLEHEFESRRERQLINGLDLQGLHSGPKIVATGVVQVCRIIVEHLQVQLRRAR
jgi:hypothetical protein